MLLEKFPDLKFRNRTFQFLPTYDIDSAYAYKNKGFVRIAANFARDLINGRLSDMKERFRVIIGKQADPFDTFDFQFSLQREYDLQPLYLF